jgi:hypothetical protein
MVHYKLGTTEETDLDKATAAWWDWYRIEGKADRKPYISDGCAALLMAQAREEALENRASKDMLPYTMDSIRRCQGF